MFWFNWPVWWIWKKVGPLQVAMDNYKHNQGVISGKSIASDKVFLLEQSNIIPSTCNAAIQQILFFLSLSRGHLRLSPCWDNSALILSSCRGCVYPQICATNKFSETLIISPIYQEHAGSQEHWHNMMWKARSTGSLDVLVRFMYTRNVRKIPWKQ